LRSAIPAHAPSDHVEVARALASLGRFPEAAETLEALAEMVDEAGAEQARARARSMRALLN
ncbi:MAG: hypothetical protein ACRD0S_05655, partial [Acidimicrobiales bacterium]